MGSLLLFSLLGLLGVRLRNKLLEIGLANRSCPLHPSRYQPLTLTVVGRLTIHQLRQLRIRSFAMEMPLHLQAIATMPN